MLLLKHTIPIESKINHLGHLGSIAADQINRKNEVAIKFLPVLLSTYKTRKTASVES